VTSGFVAGNTITVDGTVLTFVASGGPAISLTSPIPSGLFSARFSRSRSCAFHQQTGAITLNSARRQSFGQQQ